MVTAAGDASTLHAVLAAGPSFGRSKSGAGTPVQVEFVSADPTGPLSILHGRSAAVGDALANLFAWSGYQVERETYVNDAGEQTEGLARAVETRYLALAGRAAGGDDAFAEETVAPLAETIFRENGAALADRPHAERLSEVSRVLREQILLRQRETLERFGVRFDRWYSEQELHAGAIEEAVRQLQQSGSVYEEEGALWLRSSCLGDEQDRPLVRSNGVPTYIAADIAYHLDKQRRGFRRVIDIWGPDHHDYVARTRAGLRALGVEPGWLEVLILGPVTLKVDGLRVDGLNRTSHGMMLEELIEDLGAPAARLAFLERPANAPLEIDLDRMRRAGPENPFQRVLAALERADAAGRAAAAGPDDLRLSSEPSRRLEGLLERFPDEVHAAVEEREPHRILRYSLDLAAGIETGIEETTPNEGKGAAAQAPAVLARASGVVLRNALSILGVSAPEVTS